MVEGAGTTSYDYDDAGRLTQLTNWYSETTSWTYVNANRTTRHTQDLPLTKQEAVV